MRRILRALSSTDSKVSSQPSGAILSDTKLVHQSPAPATHKLAMSCVVTFAVLALAFCLGRAAGATTQDDGAGKSAAKGSAGSDDAKSDDKDSKVKTKKPRESMEGKRLEDMTLPPGVLFEVRRGERSQREPAAELTIKVLPFEKIEQKDKKRFDDLKKQEPKKEDEAFVDDYVRRQVYSLTAPDWYVSDGRKHREEIEVFLNASANPNNVSEKFLASYKRSLKKYSLDLLDNHLWARANAMRLLTLVKDDDTVGIFCDQINDPNQHEAVKFLAIKGIDQVGRKKITDVGLEGRAVATLLDVLKQQGYHQKTHMAAVRALGAIRRPSREIGLKRDVKVAVALLTIMRDPNIRRLDRHEALIALAGLNIPKEIDYNFQLVAYEIAQFAAEAAATAVKDPAIDDLHTHLFLVSASYALTADPKKEHLAERAAKHGSKQEDYVRRLGEPVKDLTVSALKIYRPGTKRPDDVAAAIEQIVRDIKDPTNRFIPRLEALNDVLKSNEPRSKKLTPETDELGPPPVLVGPKTPPKDVKDGDEAKEKVGPDAAENGRTGP